MYGKMAVFIDFQADVDTADSGTLLSCVVEKFNGFIIVCVENERSIWKKMYPIGTIYIHV